MAGLRACADLAEGMIRLSAERVSKEVLKLLAAPEPRAAVRAMARVGVLAAILPEADGLAAFEAMVELSADPVLRLSALLTSEIADVETAARRLRLANAVRDRLVVAAGGAVALTMDDRAARAMLYRLGRSTFVDRVIRAQALAGDVGSGSNLIALAQTWPIPRLPVGGRQVAAAGLAAGPLTGRVLAAFEDGWIADDFPDHGHAERLRTLVEAQRA